MSTNCTSLFFDEIHHVLLSLVAGARYGVKVRLPHAFVMISIFRNDLSNFDKVRTIIRLTIEHAKHLASFVAIYKIILGLLKHTAIYYNENYHHPSYLLKNNNQQQTTIGVKTILHSFLRSLFSSPNENEQQQQEQEKQLFLLVGRPHNRYHSLIAGAIGGYYIWGKYSSVNYQIILYLTSRVFVGLCKRYLLSYFFLQQVGDNNNNNKTKTTTTFKNESTTINEKKRMMDRKKMMNHLYSVSAAVVWALVMMLFEESPEVLHPSLRSSMNEIYRHQQQQ